MRLLRLFKGVRLRPLITYHVTRLTRGKAFSQKVQLPHPSGSPAHKKQLGQRGKHDCSERKDESREITPYNNQGEAQRHQMNPPHVCFKQPEVQVGGQSYRSKFHSMHTQRQSGL